MPQNSWKVFSGKWQICSPHRTICINQPSERSIENISVIGSPSWNSFTFQTRLRVLSESTKPPEGGAIVYFLFKNIKNYYSLHFCVSKQKIELIKRVKGVWTTLAEQYSTVRVGENYLLNIKTHLGIHQYQINQSDSIMVVDSDIQTGCVGFGVKYCNVEFSQPNISFHSRSQCVMRLDGE